MSGSIFTDAPAPYADTSAQDEEERRRLEAEQLANQGDFAASRQTFGPPAPTAPQPQMLDPLAQGAGQRTGGINPNQGGFRDPVYNPANVAPPPISLPFDPGSVLQTLGQNLQQTVIGMGPAGGQLAGIPAMTTYGQGQQAEIPYAAQVQSTLGDIGQRIGDPLNQGWRTGDVGRFIAQAPIFTNVGDAAIGIPTGAAFAGGPWEAVTGLPGVDALARAGARGIQNFALDAIPSSRAVAPEALGSLRAADVALAARGLASPSGAGIPPLDPLGGEKAFGVGSRGGGLPVPPATQPDDLMDTLSRSIEARGGTPPPTGAVPPPPLPERYPSIPEGTMGSEFPWARDMRDAANGGVREVPIDPNSPAARMGAPLAYDPQFATPPAANTAMRDLGLAPQPQAVPNPAPPEPFGRTMYDNPEVAPARLGVEGGGPPREVSADVTSPPPSSLTDNLARPDVAQQLEQRMANDALPSAPLARDLNDVANELAQGYSSPAGFLPERTLTQAGEGPGFTMRPLTPEEVRSGYVMYGPDEVAPGNLKPGEQIDGAWSGSSRTLDDVVRDLQGGYSSPAGLLPERATPPVTPPAPPTRSQEIDQLIRDAANPPSPTQSFPMTTEDAIREAERIGFPIDRGALEVGTPLARQGEMDRLSAAIDLDNFRRTSSTERDALDTWVRDRHAENATPTPPPGGYPAGVSTPASRSIYDNILDALYAPLSGDVGTALRQDLTQMLNVTNLAQSREVAGLAARMGSSRDEALKVLGELDARKAAIDTKLGKEIKLERPDIPGVREGQGLVNREVMQSTNLGRVPVLGLPFNVTGRVNAGIIDARRVLELERFVDNLPNRMLAGGADQAKAAARAQSYADMMSVFTGRGNLGGGAIEKALSKAGPLFTSLRFAASIPERVPYLLPVNRIADGSWEIMGPQWREAVREHAGFAATLGGTLLAAQQAGANVDFNKGSIKVGNTNVNLTGGISGYWNTIQKMADGDLMAGAEFLRNKVGPGPQAVVQGVQASGIAKGTPAEGVVDFLRPEWWNKGATGSGSNADRAASLIVPIWMQDVAKAMRAADDGKSLLAGAVAAPLSFMGAGVSSFAPNPRTAAVNDVMSKPENLAGLPPNVAAFLQDKSWNSATPKEQQAILAKISPEERAAIEKGEQALRDKQDVFQLNRDEAKQRSEKADQQREALKPLADKILADWKSGAMPADKALDAIKRVESAADKAANFTNNLGPKLSESPAFQDKLKELPNNKTADQKEVDRIREIQGKYYGVYDDPRVIKPDGTRDWAKIEAAQNAIMDTLRKADPGFANRVEFNLKKDPANDYEMTQWINKIDAQLKTAGYFDVPTGSKTQFAREHPDVDALLAMKFGNPVHSERAAAILTTLAPERKVQYAK